MSNKHSTPTTYTKTFTDFSFAGTSQSLTLFNLPPGYVIENVYIQHSPSFQGGAITAYTVSVGIAGDLAKYATAFDVFQQPGGDVAQFSECPTVENSQNATPVLATAVSTSGNLSVATQGSVSITITTRKLVG